MKVIQLLSFEMNDTSFYYTDAGTHYTYSGNQYIAGVWEGIKSFEQRSTPAINEHSIKLSDNDLSLTISALSGKWQWQTLIVRWLIINENNVIEDDFLVLIGAITMHDTSDDDKREITLRIQENHTLELTHGHRTSTASQHLIDSTDNCFEMIPFLDGIKLPWGKEGNGVVNVPAVIKDETYNNHFFQRNPLFSTPTESN